MKKASLLSILVAIDAAVYAALTVGCSPAEASSIQAPSMVVFGYNDLGMHCMNQDFSELCVLPPANTLRAQVIDRSGEDPRIVTSGITLTYSIPGNTESASKTNFWQFAPALFGTSLPENMGLFGFGLSGTMAVTADHDFIAQGIPLTQVTDAGINDPFQLGRVEVWKQGQLVTSTQPVVPVSWEMNCVRCHGTKGGTATNILRSHDRKHGTSLLKNRPVLCGGCHADAALGTSGAPGVKPLSTAMHSSHAPRVKGLSGEAACYSCHPGNQTQCLRGVHKANGMTCNNCHISMEAVGSPNRRPWVDEPRCGSCHNVAGHEYEQPGVLYRDSVGHHGVKCIACHGSPHAIGPSTIAPDNVQPIALQGHAGVIDTCTVCHRSQPGEPFEHRRDD